MFPHVICELTGIENLDVSNNQLEMIPETIGKIASLKKLNVTNNNLSSLPISLGKLEIEEIQFKGNEYLERLSDFKNHDIISNLKDLSSGEANWKELKLVIIGKESVGKVKNKTHFLFPQICH